MPENWDRFKPDTGLVGIPHVFRQPPKFVYGWCVFSQTAYRRTGVPLCIWQSPDDNLYEGIVFFTNKDWRNHFTDPDAIVAYEGLARYVGVSQIWMELVGAKVPGYCHIIYD